MDEKNKKTILAVDDNDLILKMVKRKLGRFYNVESAISAEEAVKIIDKQRTELDLILTDWDMVNGGDGAKVIRAGKEAGIEHLAVMSGRVGEPNINSAMLEAGATEIIAKGSDSFDQKIRSLL